jgi:capsular exopolysaccharide synthesis family protein
MIVYYEALKSTFVSISLLKGMVPKVMMVTSSTPDEGKTFFSTSFSQMLARSGKKVLIVDVDLKRAELTKDFVKGKITCGFNDLISQRTTPHNMVMKDIEPNLDFLPCKPSTVTSQDLLSSKAMEELVVWMRSNYDHVILDTPPLLAVADAIIVSRLADISLFMVRWAKTSRQMVKAAMKAFIPTGATIALIITRTHVHKLKAYDSGEAAYYYDEHKNYTP